MALKNPLKTLRGKNLQEAGIEMMTEATESIRNEIAQEWQVAMRQALGVKEKTSGAMQKMEGDLNEGEEISFAKAKQEKAEKLAKIEPGDNYHRDIIHAETMHVRKENQEMKQQLEGIRSELAKIVEASKELETAFKEVAKESITRTVTPGKYHVNFFEWMLMTIQNARVRIESSASWVNALSNKKSKRDFWSMAKSHGTSYSMSTERSISQQTG